MSEAAADVWEFMVLASGFLLVFSLAALAFDGLCRIHDAITGASESDQGSQADEGAL